MHTLKIHHHSGKSQSWWSGNAWCYAFTPICQLISISCIKSDELLADGSKSCWLSCHILVKCIACIESSPASKHWDTHTNYSTTENQSFRFTPSLLLGWAMASALIRFYGVFELNKSNSMPVHIITKMLTTTSKQRNENLVLYHVKWNTQKSTSPSTGSSPAPLTHSHTLDQRGR